MLNVVANSPRYTPAAQQAIRSQRLTDDVSDFGDRDKNGVWRPSAGYFSPDRGLNLHPPSGANYDTLQHEIGHMFDWRHGVTNFGQEHTGRPYGQIANPAALQDMARRAGRIVPTTPEIKEQPYNAAYRAFGQLPFPNLNPDAMPEHYAWGAQSPQDIPPALRMFYPQFTPAAYAPDQFSRKEWVEFEDGSSGWAGAGEPYLYRGARR